MIDIHKIIIFLRGEILSMIKLVGAIFFSCFYIHVFHTQILLFFAGEPTCEINPDDNACYCVLDSTKDTNNWFLARSYCQDINGTLVDIDAADVNTFVNNLMSSAR